MLHSAVMILRLYDVYELENMSHLREKSRVVFVFGTDRGIQKNKNERRVKDRQLKKEERERYSKSYSEHFVRFQQLLL